eukprot:scaffold12108_cov97-Isochrysis_galbana.AAC.1
MPGRTWSASPPRATTSCRPTLPARGWGGTSPPVCLASTGPGAFRSCRRGCTRFGAIWGLGRWRCRGSSQRCAHVGGGVGTCAPS